MSRLILVPQYPTKLRYQEWWYTEFPKRFKEYFDEVKVLGNDLLNNTCFADNSNQFSPLRAAVALETIQIKEYISMNIRPDDILLLCDLSFPGLFTNILFHNPPSKCFAICHATSKNAYDYFAIDREFKYPIEKATAKMFSKVFVATNYHKEKLGWKNIHTIPFPNPRLKGEELPKVYDVISVSRMGKQKISKSIEKKITKAGYKIVRMNSSSWEDYYEFLGKSKILLITSKEETYGYQVVDAIRNGCTPLAPNKFSYPELINQEFLYNNLDELLNKLESILNQWHLFESNGYWAPKASLKTEMAANYFYSTVAKIMLE